VVMKEQSYTSTPRMGRTACTRVHFTTTTTTTTTTNTNNIGRAISQAIKH
jgi:hypothetical protein